MTTRTNDGATVSPTRSSRNRARFVSRYRPRRGRRSWSTRRVDPQGSTRRGEVRTEPRVPREPSADDRSLVRPVVIHNDVDVQGGRPQLPAPLPVRPPETRRRVTSMSRRTARSRPSVWAEAGEAPTDRQPGPRRLAWGKFAGRKWWDPNRRFNVSEARLSTPVDRPSPHDT